MLIIFNMPECKISDEPSTEVAIIFMNTVENVRIMWYPKNKNKSNEQKKKSWHYMWNSNEPSPPPTPSLTSLPLPSNCEKATGEKTTNGIEIKFSIYGNFVFCPKYRREKHKPNFSINEHMHAFTMRCSSCFARSCVCVWMFSFIPHTSHTSFFRHRLLSLSFIIMSRRRALQKVMLVPRLQKSKRKLVWK